LKLLTKVLCWFLCLCVLAITFFSIFVGGATSDNTIGNFKYQTIEALALRARMRVSGQKPAELSGTFEWPAESSVCQKRPGHALITRGKSGEGSLATMASQPFAICINFRTATSDEDLASHRCLPAQAILYGEDLATIAVDEVVQTADELETATLTSADQVLLASVKSPFNSHVSNFIRHGALAFTAARLVGTDECEGFKLYHYAVTVPDPKAAMAFGLGYNVTIK